MPPFDTRLRAADLEWASLAFICFYAPAVSIQRAPGDDGADSKQII